MNIGVLQPDLSRIGGSISTILTFCDLFKKLGHSITIYSSFGERFQYNLIQDKKDIIKYYNLEHIQYNDFKWSDEFENHDTWFSRGFYSKRIQGKNRIIWTIIPQELCNDNNVRIWTNSHTTRERFGNLKEKTSVVVPPHNYEIFRNHAKSWANREYKMVSVLRGNDFVQKGIPQFANMAEKIGKEDCLLITTATNNKDLKRIQDLGIPFLLNQPRISVAEILGNSKVFFFPSLNESCPLVIYEAMNAGCGIVSRDVGAVREQLAKNGFIYRKDDEALEKVSKALENPPGEETLLRGLEFDVLNWEEKIKKELRR